MKRFFLGSLLPQIVAQFPKADCRYNIVDFIASYLSRIYLPPLSTAIRFPFPTRLIRAAGRFYIVFYAIGAIIWFACLAIALPTIVSATSSCVSKGTKRAIYNLSEELFYATSIIKTHFISIQNSYILFFITIICIASLCIISSRLKQQLQYANSPFRTLLIESLEYTCVACCRIFLIIFIIAYVDIQFPGLLQGKAPHSSIHWTCWLFILISIQSYRYYTNRNRRILEYTSWFHLISTCSLMPILARYMHITYAHKFFGKYEFKIYKIGKQKFVLVHKDLRALRSLKRFYERESLNDLLRPSNPERSFYTAEQRECFEKGYALVCSMIGKLEFSIDIANEMNHGKFPGETR